MIFDEKVFVYMYVYSTRVQINTKFNAQFNAVQPECMAFRKLS